MCATCAYCLLPSSVGTTDSDICYKQGQIPDACDLTPQSDDDALGQEAGPAQAQMSPTTELPIDPAPTATQAILPPVAAGRQDSLAFV